MRAKLFKCIIGVPFTTTLQVRAYAMSPPIVIGSLICCIAGFCGTKFQGVSPNIQ